MALSVYTRHTAACGNSDILSRRCRCPKWLQGALKGMALLHDEKIGPGFIRKSARTDSWERAEAVCRRVETEADPLNKPLFEVAGHTPRSKKTVADVVAAFIGDQEARGLSKAALKKSRTIYERQFLPWCNAQGHRLIDELKPEHLTAYRASLDNNATTTRVKHEKLFSLFRFAVDNEWMAKNPMRALKKPKAIPQRVTDYFRPDEFNALVDCTYIYVTNGGGCENRQEKLRALTLLMRWSGLAIMDAVTLERVRLTGNKVFLYRAKTGVPVYVALPPGVADMLRALPNSNPKYFFWSGNGDKESARKGWERSYWKLFEIANLGKRCHPHMFRDTFAVSLLLAGVKLDQVSLLLGHSSTRITEKHYAPFVKERQEQLVAACELAWDKRPAKPARKRKAQSVVPPVAARLVTAAIQ
jgi:integrase/recombinase XerD